MKKLYILLGVVLSVVLATLTYMSIGSAQAPMGTCIEVAPICPPGQHAICFCKSDLEVTCHYICGAIGD